MTGPFDDKNLEVLKSEKLRANEKNFEKLMNEIDKQEKLKVERLAQMETHHHPLPRPPSQPRADDRSSDEAKTTKLSPKKAKKKIRGTAALKRADMKLTDNVYVTPQSCSWEIVERSAHISPLPPPSHSAALLMSTQETRARSCLGMARSTEASSSDECGKTHCESFDISKVSSRCKLPPPSREDMLEKLKEKEMRSENAIRENLAKRKKKLMENKERYAETHAWGHLVRHGNPEGEKRKAEIAALRIAIAEKKAKNTSTTSSKTHAWGHLVRHGNPEGEKRKAEIAALRIAIAEKKAKNTSTTSSKQHVQKKHREKQPKRQPTLDEEIDEILDSFEKLLD